MKKRARKPHKTVTVDERNALVLNALRKLGTGWHDRQELAEALGKAKLNAAELVVLDLLASQGVIEKGMTPTNLITVSKWQYRIKE